MRTLSLCALMLATGCKSNMFTPFPYKVGLTVVGEGAATETTTSYKVVQDSAPVQSKGSVGFSDSCSKAKQSTGTYQAVESFFWTDERQVIGQTWSSHPKVPGSDTFDRVGVSVIKETVTSDWRIDTTETFNVPDGDPDEWEETLNSDEGTDTEASYNGVAADEYLVKMTSLGDLWTDLEEGGDLAVELMTRHNPKSGDLWASESGSVLYQYTGKTKFQIAGQNMNTDEVGLYIAGNVDPEAGDLISQCIQVGYIEVDTTHPDEEGYAHELALLKESCEDSFTHTKIGTEWWYGNVLVAFETLTTEVVINDYGFEWYEKDEDVCERMTSVETGDSARQLFVEYDLKVTDAVYEVTSWEQLSKKEVFAEDL